MLSLSKEFGDYSKCAMAFRTSNPLSNTGSNISVVCTLVDAGKSVAEIYTTYSKLRANADAYNMYTELLIYIRDNASSGYVRDAASDIAKVILSDRIDEYFAQYPDIKNYIDSNIAFAREHGYAQTLLGRRRYLADINSRNAAARTFSERNAVNMPIQGTSADMIKIAMIRIYQEFQRLGLKSKMILQVHDELVFDCYKPEEQQVRTIVEEAMLNALPLSIPIEVSIDVGHDWLSAH